MHRIKVYFHKVFVNNTLMFKLTYADYEAKSDKRTTDCV
jgi:hypothetical protein